MSYLFFSEKEANGVCGGSPVSWLRLCLPGRWSLHAQCMAVAVNLAGPLWKTHVRSYGPPYRWQGRPPTEPALSCWGKEGVCGTGGGSILRLGLSWRESQHCAFREGFHSFKDLFLLL